MSLTGASIGEEAESLRLRVIYCVDVLGVPELVYACEFDRSGYAAAAKRYLRAFGAVGHDVAWLPLRNTMHGRVPASDAGTAPETMKALPRQTIAGSPTVWHCMPQSWPAMRTAYPQGRFIGQTVWEADPIPTRWHEELAPADELWVPTRWNAEVLAASGITVPIHVVPHVVQTLAAAPPPVALDPSRFVLLTTSTWDWRKRPDLTLHAYLRAFTADDPVSLVVKTGARVHAWNCDTAVETHTWWQVMNVVRQYPNPAEVILVTDEWTDAQMVGMTAAADCYVSLTCSEGWGLGAFDAATAGVPVIMTGHGGQTEWLGTEHPGLVPFQLVPADHPDTSMFELGMVWAIADVDAAADMMRAVFHRSSPIIDVGPVLAGQVADRYSEQAIGQLMTELLA